MIFSVSRPVAWVICVAQALMISVGLLFMILDPGSVKDDVSRLVAVVIFGGYLAYLIATMRSYWKEGQEHAARQKELVDNCRHTAPPLQGGDYVTRSDRVTSWLVLVTGCWGFCWSWPSPMGLLP
jgi:hypothetical protein